MWPNLGSCNNDYWPNLLLVAGVGAARVPVPVWLQLLVRVIGRMHGTNILTVFRSFKLHPNLEFLNWEFPETLRNSQILKGLMLKSEEGTWQKGD